MLNRRLFDWTETLTLHAGSPVETSKNPYEVR